MHEPTATIYPFDAAAFKARVSRDLIGSEQTITAPITDKLRDALTPGFLAEFDPAEAEQAGAFEETALDEEDAFASSCDAPPHTARTVPPQE